MGSNDLKPGDTSRAAPIVGGPRVIVAAFGKHPSEPDHLDGINIGNDILARLHQTLRHGIEKQIDTKAWEKLNPEQRIEGFDHTFLLLTSGHAVLGLMWSSVDKRGRKEFPMVVCADCEGAALETFLTNTLPELSRLRDVCKAADSVRQLTVECSQAQERLRRTLLAGALPVNDTAISKARQQFLETSDLGPERVGLLRLVYDLNTALGTSGTRTPSTTTSSSPRSHGVRVPMASASATEALLLWSSFLSCAAPPYFPVFLLLRAGVDWMDGVVGSAATDSFFCLQASPKGLPLTTAIPYQLPPDSGKILAGVETNFLNHSFQPAQEKSHTPRPIEPAKPSQATQPTPVARPPPSGTRRWLVWAGFVVLTVAAVVAWFLFFKPQLDQKSSPTPDSPATGKSGANASSSKAAAAQTTAPSRTPVPRDLTNSAADASEVRQLIQAGQTFMTNHQYKQAQQSFTDALKIRPEDGAIAAYMKDAKQAQKGVQEEEDFTAATTACKAALEEGRVEDAQRQLAAAKALKPNDPQTLVLSVQLGQSQRKKQQDQYDNAVSAARQALATNNLDEAIRLATLAVGLSQGDGNADRIVRDAKQKKEIAAQYQHAMAVARSALSNGDYANASAQADQALLAKPGDIDAAKLKATAESQLKVAREQAAKFQEAIQTARQSYVQKDYSNVISEANIALAARSDDAEALRLRQNAQGRLNEIALQFAAALKAAQDALAQGDYTNAFLRCEEALAIKQDEPSARDLKSRVMDAQSKAASMRNSNGSNPSFAGANNLTNQAACDQMLRNLMVRLGVSPVKRGAIQTNGATASPLPHGILSQATIDWYMQSVDTLRKSYQDHNWLDPERDEDLKHLKTAIRLGNE